MAKRMGLMAARPAMLMAMLAVPGVALAHGAPTTALAKRCPALAGARFAPADGGRPVQILAARLVPASAAAPAAQGETMPALPAHCQVTGVIDPRTGAHGKPYGIRFEVNLPLAWNGRFLLQGGGGLNGTVRPAVGSDAAGTVPALARGFAVASHDSGHQGAVFDAAFRADQRATLDFAQAAVPAVAQLGKAIAARFFGRAPSRSYMAGCSTGGRETMLAMERYPTLFDGLVIGAPAMRTGFSNLGTSYAKVMFNQAAPRDPQGLPMPDKAFSPADRKTIRDGLLAQCDALDGRADGMIMAVAQCHFRPAALQCREGQQSGCLSAGQVNALTRAFAGPRDAAGHPLYAPVPFDTGVVDTAGPISGYIADGRTDILGPPNRDLAIDLDARAAVIRADWMQALTDTDGWTDLGTFLGHQGKVLFYHGVSDPWFSAFDTLDYWQRAGKSNGAAWAQGSRFYMVPGMAHCRGGDAFDRFDLLGAVVDWVEQGKAPAGVVATRSAGTAARPLCPWPSYARYRGGDPALAESYSCADAGAGGTEAGG
ncbi:tannase/feruloyl esterase family alpha/beta hydrolase [Novosphingobium sp. SG720]|uniref:tannase/feruloyl esterase family alpha/beta hydrolase n=1 Tax=Novosphingobium sp. SG720 TaxID=2586998 RepID=UPI001445B101|nr:tannase/feruloyl esterase family alpha/beta hydrolase [Novosphingobium sp. SG720]NKJ44673.1 feruloyl esterase [Novosphingobium sp. SG720]